MCAIRKTPSSVVFSNYALHWHLASQWYLTNDYFAIHRHAGLDNSYSTAMNCTRYLKLMPDEITYWGYPSFFVPMTFWWLPVTKTSSWKIFEKKKDFRRIYFELNLYAVYSVYHLLYIINQINSAYFRNSINKVGFELK